MVQSHPALGDWFWDTRRTLTRARGGPPELGCAVRGCWRSMSPSCPCALLLARGRALTTAQRSTGAAAGVNGQGEGAAVASRRELALIVVVEEFCGCSGSLRKE